MKTPVKLISIPPDKYSCFRRQVIFSCYKWDPQVGDVNTIGDQVAIISAKTGKQLCQWAEQLAAETLELEMELTKRPELYPVLGLSRPIQKALSAGRYHPDQNVRLMRFDFHPTKEGWMVSEVNSDVPGGFGEASRLNQLAASLFPCYISDGDVGTALTNSFSSLIPEHGRVAFVHATSYSDDRQVMHFLSETFQKAGFKCLMIAPDHLRWDSTGPISIAVEQEGPVQGVVRFFPAEWLQFLPRSSAWQGFFLQSVSACNHPAAILTQSKRLPLIWDQLQIPVPTWRRLLPETVDPRKMAWRNDPGWILKPAFGRVGGDISIPEAISPKERIRIYRDATFFPNRWVAQRRFNSLPLPGSTGNHHLCIGVFTVNGRAAGFYGRLSFLPRIDERAQDIAVLIERKDVANNDQ